MANKALVRDVKKIDAATDERARAAVKEFRKLIPTLTTYARVITGKNLRVVMSPDSNGKTDGESIFYRPPLSLGDRTPHDRRTCDTRDPVTSRMVCPACDQRETVLATIYHEIGHNVGDSFAATTERDKISAIEFAIREYPGEWSRVAEDKLRSHPASTSFLGLAKLINEFLPSIVGALEDARVDTGMFEARAGLRKMFAVKNRELFTIGVEQPDGTRLQWRDAVLNAQVIIGCYVKAVGGHDYSSYFHPDAVKALDDPELTALTDQVASTSHVSEVYNLSFKVLARLRDLGYCGTPQDPDPELEPEPEPEPEPEEETEDEQSDDEPEPGDGEPDPNKEEGESDSDPLPSPDAGDSDSVHPVEGDEEGAAESPGDGEPGPDDDNSNQADGSGGDGEPGKEKIYDGQGEATDGEPSDGVGEADQQPSDGGEPGQDEPSGDEPTAGGSDGDGDDQSTERDEGADGVHETPESSEPVSGGDPDGDELGDGSDDRASDGEADTQGDGNPGDPEGADSGSPEQGEGSVAADQAPSDEAGDLEGPVLDDPAQRPEDMGVDPGEGESSSDRVRSPEDEGRKPGLHEPPRPENDGSDSTLADASDSNAEARNDDAEGVGTGDSSPSLEQTTDSSMDSDASELHHESHDSQDPAGELDDNSEVHHDQPEPLDSSEESEESEAQNDQPRLGSFEEVAPMVGHFTGHDEEGGEQASSIEDAAIDRAVIQGSYFETPSTNIYGVREHYYDKPILDDRFNYSGAWYSSESATSKKRKPNYKNLDIPETVLGPALGRMRRALSDNQRGSQQLNRTSGKINARALGKRAALGDPRLFKKSILPGKKDYEVFILMDISGSTAGENLRLMKRSVMAQAHLLNRVGVRFTILAHTAIFHDFGAMTDPESSLGLDLDIYHIKDADEPWETKVQDRLASLSDGYANLDGHALEYGRKLADKSRAAHKIIMYYSDGSMPAENYDEELDILTAEIRTCNVKGYTLLGVGINTDSPREHGLDTVQVDGDDDLKAVVNHLGKRLAAKG